MNQQETLQKIGEIWVKYPMLRLGQMLETAQVRWLYRNKKHKEQPHPFHPCSFYLENEDFAKMLDEFDRSK